MPTLKAEQIFSLGRFLNITNTYLTSLIVVMIISVCFLIIRKKIALIPKSPQILIEIIFEKLYNYWLNIFGEKNIFLFSFCLTFFIYIIFANWFGVLPLVNSLYIVKDHEKVHLLRSVYSDLNMSLALAIISIVFINVLCIIKIGRQFIKKFIGFIGFLEFVSELSKILSFSFRLFGNVFAGEILLLVISALIPLFIPLPFIILEVFVGFVQAFIFFTLTTIFLRVALKDNH
ncbi:MAG: ATP synthase subunit a [Candidatus Parcubacteria bacterium]|nr:MAG: ATP synthase subunit a [Candidatus Parcubacteria bacterium]